MRHALIWNALLSDAVHAVFSDGLHCRLEPSVERLRADAVGAHLPLRSAGDGLRLSLQMDPSVADLLGQKLGAVPAAGDAGLLSEVVTECANLVSGRLAGLVCDELGPLEMGTPCAGTGAVEDPQSVTQTYRLTGGGLQVRLEVIR